MFSYSPIAPRLGGAYQPAAATYSSPRRVLARAVLRQPLIGPAATSCTARRRAVQKSAGAAPLLCRLLLALAAVRLPASPPALAAARRAAALYTVGSYSFIRTK